ncbi:MAG: BA14K family protein [Pseudomonadota bacterium]
MMAKTILPAFVFAALVGVAAPQTAAAQSVQAQCDSYARQIALQRGNAGNVATGTVAGAAVGAAIGAITGGAKGAGRGAAIGAGSGLVGSSVVNSAAYNRAYRRAYNDCLAQNTRATRPAASGGSLEPWSAEWYRACAARYRSFNAQTGHYTAYSGRKRFCNL